MMQTAKHTFFISGGISSLGKASALHLAALDANVIIADLNIDAVIRLDDAMRLN